MKNEVPKPMSFDSQSIKQQNISTSSRMVSSEVLLSGGRELVIVHQGKNYHLRLTNQGKLILTK